jgi:hypothetical protein
MATIATINRQQEESPMPNGILIVESQPASPEEVDTYHDWYDNTHLPEIVQVDGFVSARRLQSLGGDTFIVVYEIEGDVEAAKAALGEAQGSGSMSRPNGVQLSPPPSVRYFTSI